MEAIQLKTGQAKKELELPPQSEQTNSRRSYSSDTYCSESQNSISFERGGTHRALPLPFGANVPAQRPEVCGLRLHSKAEVGASKSQTGWSGRGWEGEMKEHPSARKGDMESGYLTTGGNAFLAVKS